LNDFRTFLRGLKAQFPGDVVTIADRLDDSFVPTAMALELDRRERPPLLVFKALCGSDMPFVTNVFASRDRLAWAIRTTRERFHDTFNGYARALIPPVVTEAGPVSEEVWTGEALDVRRLPATQHFSQDAGRYFTAAIVVAKDPDTGVRNLSYHRLQIKGPTRLGASLHSRSHLWDYFLRAEARGQDLDCAVVLGAHPAIMLAAAGRMGIDQDEYELAGAMLGEPVELQKCHTVDVEVPARAEIVLEGRLLAGTYEDEGPFGEYTGYATGRSTRNVFQLSAITRRRDSVYVDIVPGNSGDHLVLGRAAKEAFVWGRLKELFPHVTAINYPSSGTHYHCYVSLRKTVEGQVNHLLSLLFGLDNYIKTAIVVDDDINIFDESQVMWALATRMQPDRDLLIIPNFICNRLDPSSRDGVGAKLGIDATRPEGWTFQRATVPESSARLARELLQQGK
jgi:UbiD family decarboxylase